MLTGRCLCGNCTYEIEGDPVVVAHCHCADCQRLSGAGHATGAMFPESAVRMEGSIATFELVSEAGNRVTRLFCPTCGSPLFGKNTGMPGFITATAGTLDQSETLSPQVAIFARNRRAWDVMDLWLPSRRSRLGGQPKEPKPPLLTYSRLRPDSTLVRRRERRLPGSRPIRARDRGCVKTPVVRFCEQRSALRRSVIVARRKGLPPQARPVKWNSKPFSRERVFTQPRPVADMPELSKCRAWHCDQRFSSSA